MARKRRNNVFQTLKTRENTFFYIVLPKWALKVPILAPFLPILGKMGKSDFPDRTNCPESGTGAQSAPVWKNEPVPSEPGFPGPMERRCFASPSALFYPCREICTEEFVHSLMENVHKVHFALRASFQNAHLRVWDIRSGDLTGTLRVPKHPFLLLRSKNPARVALSF